MSYDVITIARTLCAGGEELGKVLAEELGMRYVDAEIIDRAAARAGVTTAEMAQTEARKGLVQRIFDCFALGSVGGDTPITGNLAQAPGYAQLIVDVIRETAAAGNAVIVAHGAAIPLADAAGTLRIFVTASMQTRIARLTATGEREPRARKMIEDSDAERAEFFARFYKLEYEHPTYYDLVINTDRLSIAEATNLIRPLIR